MRAVIALGYGLEDRGSRVRFPAGNGNFSLHHRIKNGSVTHQASYRMGTRGGAGRGVKLTTHLHVVPRSRMRGARPPLPQYVFIAWCLVKHRDNFTFTFAFTSTSHMSSFFIKKIQKYADNRKSKLLSISNLISIHTM
jgi:hypothetical protein